MGPSSAFTLFLLGVLGVYREFVRPGGIVPGVAGCVLTIVGGYFLWQNSLNTMGIALLAVAAALFIVETFWKVDLVAGILGTMALSWGFCLLINAPRRIAPALAIPLSVVFGAITLLLSYGAKRARRNKWADIDGRS